VLGSRSTDEQWTERAELNITGFNHDLLDDMRFVAVQASEFIYTARWDNDDIERDREFGGASILSLVEHQLSRCSTL